MAIRGYMDATGFGQQNRNCDTAWTRRNYREEIELLLAIPETRCEETPRSLSRTMEPRSHIKTRVGMSRSHRVQPDTTGFDTTTSTAESAPAAVPDAISAEQQPGEELNSPQQLRFRFTFTSAQFER
jgi:hypothetical protein